MRVLITRPEPDASRTARKVAGLGFEPVVLPLFECVREDGLAERISGPHSAVIFTSVNGARAYAASCGNPDIDLAAYAVGERTADAARQAGFEKVRTGHGTGTGAGLARRILDDLASGLLKTRPDLPLLYLAGIPRRPDLERMLNEQSVHLWVEVAYRMKEISYSTDFYLQAKLSPPPDIVLLFSPNAARRFRELAALDPLTGSIGKLIPLCISQAVADNLDGELYTRARVAPIPNEAAMLESLSALR